MDAGKYFLLVLIAFIGACDSIPSDKAFKLLYHNDYDSAKLYFENYELEYLFDNKMFFKHHYTYEIVQNQVIILKIDGIPIERDTIEFTWNGDQNVIQISDREIVELLRHEIMVAIQLAIFNQKQGKEERVDDWLLPTADSILNYRIGKALYDLDELNLAYPYLNKAMEMGNLKSGLLLADLYMMSGQRSEAIKLLKRLATERNSDAMVKLGTIYDTYSSKLGLYNPPSDANDSSSFEWYKKATKLGNAIAMQRMGYIYQAGINRKESLDSAIYWYNKSSELGEPSATVELALISLRSGDIEKGFELMDKAIKQNNSLGYFEFGKIYEYGIGVKQNKLKALKYYEKADSLGSPVAYIRIKKLQKTMHNL